MAKSSDGSAPWLGPKPMPTAYIWERVTIKRLPFDESLVGFLLAPLVAAMGLVFPIMFFTWHGSKKTNMPRNNTLPCGRPSGRFKTDTAPEAGRPGLHGACWCLLLGLLFFMMFKIARLH